jgi:acyl dehydratase
VATTTRELDGAPSALPLYLKAALPAVPGAALLPGVGRSGSTLPDLTLTRDDVHVDRSDVDAYAEVCGFAVRDALPLTYPHLLAFGLHLTLMTDPTFPFPAIGLVHVGNSITAHRAISPEEPLRVSAHAEGLRAHPKGRAFDLVSTVHSGDELVWEETSTFLRRGGGDASRAETAGPDPSLESVPPSGSVWKLGGDLGRRYAAVSGDKNPIHLYGVTAKAFGFPRQIAHGMWSKARCLAALEGRLPDAVRVDVAFKAPILLPGSVAFGSRPITDGRNRNYAFSLSKPKNGTPHLLGRTSAV